MPVTDSDGVWEAGLLVRFVVTVFMGCLYCLSVLHSLHFSCQTSLLKLGLNRQSFVFVTRLEDDGLPGVVSNQHWYHSFGVNSRSSASSCKYRCKDIGAWSRA